MSVSDKIREQARQLPHNLVADIDDSNLRLFAFVMLDTATALIESIALAVENSEEG